MRQLYQNILFLSILLISFGCKKTIRASLSEYVEGIVINTQISDIDSITSTITHTTEYYATLHDSLLRSAQVEIINNSDNQSYQLYTKKGSFFYPELGKTGKNYTLIVKYDGQTYTANSTMPVKVKLDSVTFNKTNLLGDEIINTIVHFQDPPNDSNYYRFTVTILRTGKTNSFNMQDRLSEGKYIHYTLRNDSAYIRENDSIQVDMMCVTKETYQFYYGIETTAGANEKFLSSLSPANPPTNLSNNALGIFDVHTTQKVNIKVPNEFINTIKWEDLITW